MPSTKRIAQGFAIATLTAAQTGAFMCGPGYPCGTSVNFSGAQAAMKAMQKFEPKVEQTPDAVLFKFQSASEDDLEAQITNLGTCASTLNVKWKNAEMPFGFQGMANRSSVARTFFMPRGLDTEKMSTSYEDGFYTVKLPKKVQDEVAKQTAASESNNSSNITKQQQQAPYSAADYLKSLSNPPKQESEQTASQQQQQQRSPSSSSSNSGPTSFGQYVDSLLSEMFGVPPGTDLFAPPSEEQIAAAKAQAAKMEEARKARYIAMKRASMHMSWEQSPETYTVSIDIPEQTASGDVKLVSVAKRGLEVRLAKGGVRRIALPSDALSNGVTAKFERDSDKGEDLVRRCIITIPKDQPQTINIQMA